MFNWIGIIISVIHYWLIFLNFDFKFESLDLNFRSNLKSKFGEMNYILQQHGLLLIIANF